MHMHMHMSHAHVQADVPRRHHVHFFMALALQDPDNFVPMMFRAQIVMHLAYCYITGAAGGLF